MQAVKFFLAAAAVLVCGVLILRDKFVAQSDLAAFGVVSGVAVAAVVVLIGIFAFKNKKSIGELSNGNYSSLGSFLFGKKKQL